MDAPGPLACLFGALACLAKNSPKLRRLLFDSGLLIYAFHAVVATGGVGSVLSEFSTLTLPTLTTPCSHFAFPQDPSDPVAIQAANCVQALVRHGMRNVVWGLSASLCLVCVFVFRPHRAKTIRSANP